MKSYSVEEGEELVKAARYAIELFLKSPYFDRKIIYKKIEKFKDMSGAFVTLEHYPTGTLRGCIGFPLAIKPLYEAVVDAAISAATEDPRFVPLSHVELAEITIEVSILSKMERITGKPEEIKEQVKVGRDGLFIEYGYYSGLLLPIVAVEEGWNSEEFLDNVCMKAGLPTHTWQRSDVSLYRFTTQIFREIKPEDGVEEIKL
ncbi:MAG: TIGR00296 family protein [Candidatus Micrarchaeia archaeon]